MKHLALRPAHCCVCAGTTGRPVFKGCDIEFLTCDNEFTFIACDGCGHLYLSPRPRLEDLPVIYRDYLTENRSSAYYPSSFVAHIKDKFDARRLRPVVQSLRQDSAVLDIGAGAGRLLRLLRDTSAVNLRLYANDLWFDTETRRELEREHIEMIEGAIETVATDLRFDAITAVHVIEHVDNPPEMLEWIAAHLTEDGTAYLETPDTAAPARVLFGSKWGMTHFPRHFNLFSRAHLADLAARNGLVVVRHQATTSAPAWNMSVRNLLRMDALSKRGGLLDIFNYSNVGTLGAFTLLDLALMAIGLPTSTQQLVLRRVRPGRGMP